MSISSLSLSNASRATILRLQTELRDAEKELSTGRHADVGATLGRLTGTSVSYHSQTTGIERMLNSNKLVTSRLELADDTLDALSKSAESLRTQVTALTAMTGATGTVETVADAARSSLQAMTGALNVSTTGQYLFAGSQTDLTPMRDGSQSVADGFAAFLTAVTAKTGVTTTAANVSAEDLEAFFSTDGYVTDPTTNPPTALRFDDLFDDANWAGNWSNASDTPIESRISKSETIESSLTANEQAFRKIAAGYSMLASLDMGQMSETARSVVAKAANVKLAEGMDAVTNLRTDVGMRINRIELADTALTQQKDIVAAAIDRLEGVDYSEASLRITQLQTQLEASYTVTGRLRSLSLLDYI